MTIEKYRGFNMSLGEDAGYVVYDDPLVTSKLYALKRAEDDTMLNTAKSYVDFLYDSREAIEETDSGV